MASVGKVLVFRFFGQLKDLAGKPVTSNSSVRYYTGTQRFFPSIRIKPYKANETGSQLIGKTYGAEYNPIDPTYFVDSNGSIPSVAFFYTWDDAEILKASFSLVFYEASLTAETASLYSFNEPSTNISTTPIYSAIVQNTSGDHVYIDVDLNQISLNTWTNDDIPVPTIEIPTPTVEVATTNTQEPSMASNIVITFPSGFELRDFSDNIICGDGTESGLMIRPVSEIQPLSYNPGVVGTDGSVSEVTVFDLNGEDDIKLELYGPKISGSVFLFSSQSGELSTLEVVSINEAVPDVYITDTALYASSANITVIEGAQGSGNSGGPADNGSGSNGGGTDNTGTGTTPPLNVNNNNIDYSIGDSEELTTTTTAGNEVMPSSISTINTLAKDDAIVVVFNDTIDATSLSFERLNEHTAKCVSIRYVYMDGNNVEYLTDEVPAKLNQQSFLTGTLAEVFSNTSWDWTLKESTNQLRHGQFQFDTTENVNDTIVIAPPVGGWPEGVTVRVEFDRSIKDDAGNDLINDLDQVIFARVIGMSEMVFNSPTQNITYFPYVDGSQQDLTVVVTGYVKDSNGVGDIKNIKIKMTAANGYTLDINQDVGTQNLDTITNQGHRLSYIKDPAYKNGGTFSASFRLPVDPASQHYRWDITGKITSYDDVETNAYNSKTVFHETESNKPDFLTVQIGGKDALIGPVKFRKGQAGDKSINVTLRGDYEDETAIQFVNTYVSSDTHFITNGNVTNHSSPSATDQSESISVAGFGSFTIGTNPLKDDGKYAITISATTKAGSQISRTFQIDIDTIGLSVKSLGKRAI